MKKIYSQIIHYSIRNATDISSIEITFSAVNDLHFTCQRRRKANTTSTGNTDNFVLYSFCTKEIFQHTVPDSYFKIYKNKPYELKEETLVINFK